MFFFQFSQNLLTSRKLAKKLRKFFIFSKFTKLVNLLVLETQGENATQNLNQFDTWIQNGTNGFILK